MPDKYLIRPMIRSARWLEPNLRIFHFRTRNARNISDLTSLPWLLNGHSSIRVLTTLITMAISNSTLSSSSSSSSSSSNISNMPDSKMEAITINSTSQMLDQSLLNPDLIHVTTAAVRTTGRKTALSQGESFQRRNQKLRDV